MNEDNAGSIDRDFDQANAAFWDELCGTTLAQSLGIIDRSRLSIETFDRAYMDLYPYLLDRIGIRELDGKHTLEVGLGYGTLSQKLAEVAAGYTGLDVAAGPVDMVNHRLQLQGLTGVAIQGSMLHAPLESQSFDAVVSIGCFHHTGNIQRCVDETFRLLRPGGMARIMLYNQFSYRHWLRWPRQTLDIALRKPERLSIANSEQRSSYDANALGEAAPETVFSSIRELRGMFRAFTEVSFHKENCAELPLGVHRFVSRRTLLPTLGRVAGLDIYVEAKK